MSYYKTCPLCGAHLAPGEVCECKREAALGAANTGDGPGTKQRTYLFVPHSEG